MSGTGDARRRIPARDGEAGATLLEALVVVAITVMIATIGYPQLEHGVAGAAFGQAVSGVRADLRIARAQALRTGERVDVMVDENGRGYGWTPGPQRGLIAGLTLMPVGRAASFFPDGSSSGSDLVLTNGHARARFELDGGTGVLKVMS